MRSNVGIRGVLFLASLGMMMLASVVVSTAQEPITPRTLPNPIPVFIGPEFYQTGGKQFTRYNYSIENSSAYPKEMFAASPDLPPCGQNTKAARTWVDIYDQGGKRLNGFCALGSPGDLGNLWFALEVDVIPPSYVYIEMTDRKTNTKYKSMLSETTQ